jgi:hypothetical protein
MGLISNNVLLQNAMNGLAPMEVKAKIDTVPFH